jgi:hypothetical protein
VVYQEAEKISMSEQPTSTDFDTVRKIALSFPGVIEGTSYGTPAFRVGKKFLARLREDGDLVLKVGDVQSKFLIEAEPDIYYITDHYRGWGSVLIRLSQIRPVAFQYVFEETWRQYASKRDIATYETQGNTHE